MSGLTGYLAGLSAEDAMTRHYEAKGAKILARRWRGAGGELDLVVEDDGVVVVVEVKKSRTFDMAAARLTRKQISRLYAAAEEFLGTLINGGLRNTRFDVALFDASGQHRVLENALCA